MPRAKLTETLLRRAAVDWLAGKSWRALGPVYGCHPKYLQTQAKRLGYLAPENIRTCPVCQEPKVLPEFTRPSSGGKDTILHECNVCAATQLERQRPILPPEPLEDTEVERLRQEAMAHANAYLAKQRAKHRAMAATKALLTPPPTE